ncbi:MAG: polysaccharide biosynthesis tyrosine autokinase [Bacteroidia bacterium]|nr:polysaccharide biosynthesis tyrosine autokinase [Bacteroidia bacterium]MCZ2278088.1 polysaccharide biosynthesis tyrosine autokinase [Bacteroidia bacterium]
MKTANTANAIVNQQDIKNLFVKVLKNWYWILIFVILCGAASYIYLRKSTYIYGAQAKILIKPQKNQLQDALSKSFGSQQNEQDVANEMEILKSSKLVGETVNKLKLDVSYFIKGRLRTGEIYQGVPFIVVDAKILDYNFYGVPFNISILNSERYTLQIENESYSFNKTYKFGEPVVNDKFSFIINGKTEQIEGNSKLSEVNYQFTINNAKQLLAKYQNALRLEKDYDASVIKINVEDEIPERAVAFLDTLSHLYIDYSVSVQREINTNTIKFIEDLLEDVTGVLNSVETNLEQYQRQTGTVSTEEQGAMYLQQKADAETELSKLQVQQRSVDYLYESLTSGGDMTTISPSLLSEQADPTFSQAFQELSQLIQKRNNLLFSNTPNSPVVKEVDVQIETGKTKLLQMILNLRRSLLVKINGLNAQLGKFQSRISMIPSTQKGIVNINRKVAINEKIYIFLLETRAQTVISSASIVPDKSIIEPSSSTGLIKPIRNKIMIMGFGVAMALSFMLIFLKGLFYNYITTKDDITALTNLPVIGVIGQSKEAKGNYLVVEKSPQSLTTEAFRVIRTNLSFYSTQNPSKILLLTSNHPGEGKTFCSVNIASILAKTKKKVILIDLDLHKPKQANAFNLKNDIGISTFLAGKSSLNEIIQESPVENLDLILSGPRTPNASELLHEPALEQMLIELRKRYEYILLDSPPVGLLSDSLLLMKYSDINLFVLKAYKSKKDSVELALNLAEKNQIKKLSFILNGVSAKNIPAGYGGSYYYNK